MALAVFLQLQGEMLYLWFFIATVNSIVSHCGYAIASNFHDVHHAEHKVNFGTFGLSDWWHHTYKINH